MEAASFGQTEVISKLLTIPDLELDAVNIRGQTAAEVALNRSHPTIADRINEEIQVKLSFSNFKFKVSRKFETVCGATKVGETLLD